MMEQELDGEVEEPNERSTPCRSYVTSVTYPGEYPVILRHVQQPRGGLMHHVLSLQICSASVLDLGDCACGSLSYVGTERRVRGVFVK